MMWWWFYFYYQPYHVWWIVDISFIRSTWLKCDVNIISIVRHSMHGVITFLSPLSCMSRMGVILLPLSSKLRVVQWWFLPPLQCMSLMVTILSPLQTHQFWHDEDFLSIISHTAYDIMVIFSCISRHTKCASMPINKSGAVFHAFA